MAKDGFGIEPQFEHAAGLAARLKCSLTYAEHVLDELCERGMAVKLGDRYRITSRGMAMGEKMGVTVSSKALIAGLPGLPK